MSKRFLLLLLLVSGNSAAHILPGDFQGTETRWSIGVENHDWKEYLADDSLLLSESGYRFTAGWFIDNFSRDYPGYLARLKTHFYGAIVDYDGHTSLGTRVMTKVDYAGWRSEFLLGYRGGDLRRLSGLEIQFGSELDVWMRHLRSANDVQGNPASGYFENYFVLSPKASLGFYLKPLRTQMQIGTKYPLARHEYVMMRLETFNQGYWLRPGKQFSFFASLEWQIPLWGGYRHRMRAYYESFRFAQSAVSNNSYQPRSALNVIGFSLNF